MACCYCHKTTNRVRLLYAITKPRKRGSEERPDKPVSREKQNGSDPGATSAVDRKGLHISFEGEISFGSKGEISFESRQDQLRVERKAHVQLWSSLLVGGIAASLTITRARAPLLVNYEVISLIDSIATNYTSLVNALGIANKS